jgi:Carboxypeptidase regulatory-like domain
MNQKRVSQVIAVLLVFLCSSLPLLAALTGDIQGTVLDAKGLVVADARIVIKNIGTDVTRTLKTNTEGEFSAQQLDVGTYELTIEKQGFNTFKAMLVVRSGEVTRLNFTLEVGAVSQVVTVEAGAEAFLDTVNSQISTSISEVDVKELPVINRDPLAFATLSPGIAPVSKDNPFLGSGSFNANGQRGRANNITIDNAVASDISTTGGSGIGTFSLDEVQEFKLITDNFSAEFGRNSGAQVQIITKSGTNQYHGSVYEFHQDAAGNARDYFNSFTPQQPHGAVTPVVNNLWGFAAGGPVVKDHLFVFGHYEGNKVRGAGSTNTATVLTPAQAAGITNPTSQALFQAVGAPTGTPTASGASGTVSNSAPNATDTYSWALRVDESFRGGKDVISSRYGTDPVSQVRPGLVFIGTALPNYGASVTNTARTYTFGETHAFGSATINQFRFAFSRTKPIFQPFTTLTAPFAPQILISGFSALGVSNIIPQGRTENVFQYSDTVSWSRGRHSFKVGGDAFRYQQNSFFDSNFRGTFNFASVAAFQSGTVQAFTENVGNSVRGNRNTDVFGFAQDDYRITNSLTVNLGVRFETAGGVSEVHNTLSNIDLNNPAPLGGGGTGPLGSVDLGGTSFQRNYNWAPRVGAAWNPNHGKFVVRGGYGWTYDFIYQNPITNLRFAAPFIPSVSLNGAAISGSNSYANLVAGTSSAQASAIAAIGTFPANQVNFGSFSAVSLNLKNPLSKQASAGVEYQLSKDYVVKASWVGVFGSDLQVSLPINLFTGANRPAPATSLADETTRLGQFQNAFNHENGTGSGSVVNFRLDPRFNGVTQVQSIGTSNYQGLQLVAIKQPSHGLSFQASYTYAHSIDDISDALGVLVNDAANLQDPTNLRGNRSNSQFDLRHRVVLNHVYEIPFTNRFEGTARKFLHGWAVSGIFSYQTGFPTSIFAGSRRGISENALQGNVAGAIRANGDPTLFQPAPIGSPAASAIPGLCARGIGNVPGTTTPCVDTSNFPLTQPLLGNIGTSPRNALRLADFWDYDAGLLKDTKITEKMNLQFRWEVYNVFNHPNFSGFVNTLTSPNFGTYTSTASNERQLQYSLKLTF